MAYPLPTVGELAETTAHALAIEPAYTRNVARWMRDAGLLQRGSGGRRAVNAGRVTIQDAANFLIATIAAPSPNLAPDAARIFAPMPALEAVVKIENGGALYESIIPIEDVPIPPGTGENFVLTTQSLVSMVATAIEDAACGRVDSPIIGLRVGRDLVKPWAALTLALKLEPPMQGAALVMYGEQKRVLLEGAYLTSAPSLRVQADAPASALSAIGSLFALQYVDATRNPSLVSATAPQPVAH